MISYTTRPPRAGELEGKDYYFVDDPAFDQLIQNGIFLEWAHVHNHRYGTPRTRLMEKLDQGIDMILEIDIQGAAQVRKTMAMYNCVSIFVLPSSPATLQHRLQQRGKDNPAVIDLRLKNARHEVQAVRSYNYLICNDDLEIATRELIAIILAQRCKIEYRSELIGNWQPS